MITPRKSSAGAPLFRGDPGLSKVPARVQVLLPFGGLVVMAIVLLGVLPSALEPVDISQFAKYFCIAIVAVGIGLAWGRGGMLVLGQGLFFGLGAYMMAMHIQLDDAGAGRPPVYLQNVGEYDDSKLPAFWEPFRTPVVTIMLIVLVPSALAVALGLAVFKRRVKGAYFAVLSQAVLYAFTTYIDANQLAIGGKTGLTSLRRFFGMRLSDRDNQKVLYYVAATVLLVAVAAMIWLYRSRFGEVLVACRDAEERVRFLGYDPANIKLVAYVLSAILAAVAGALYTPINQHIGTGDFAVTASIMMIIGVAVGGRATLFGPAVGAIVLAYLQYNLSSDYPTAWQYIIGGLFVVVVAVLPGGLVDLPTLLVRARHWIGDLVSTRSERAPAPAEATT